MKKFVSTLVIFISVFNPLFSLEKDDIVWLNAVKTAKDGQRLFQAGEFNQAQKKYQSAVQQIKKVDQSKYPLAIKQLEAWNQVIQFCSTNFPHQSIDSLSAAELKLLIKRQREVIASLWQPKTSQTLNALKIKALQDQVAHLRDSNLELIIDQQQKIDRKAHGYMRNANSIFETLDGFLQKYKFELHRLSQLELGYKKKIKLLSLEREELKEELADDKDKEYIKLARKILPELKEKNIALTKENALLKKQLAASKKFLKEFTKLSMAEKEKALEKEFRYEDQYKTLQLNAMQLSNKRLRGDLEKVDAKIKKLYEHSDFRVYSELSERDKKIAELTLKLNESKKQFVSSEEVILEQVKDVENKKSFDSQSMLIDLESLSKDEEILRQKIMIKTLRRGLSDADKALLKKLD